MKYIKTYENFEELDRNFKPGDIIICVDADNWSYDKFRVGEKYIVLKHPASKDVTFYNFKTVNVISKEIYDKVKFYPQNLIFNKFSDAEIMGKWRFVKEEDYPNYLISVDTQKYNI